ncbi:MAG TPA: EVE domain-containing protein [Bacteroidia bacterium]|nr:EVE domain-containing protein [Bacteroidia bacterium]HNT79975.1 EVE domain-containing protein [Bacteroidia bacterium]
MNYWLVKSEPTVYSWNDLRTDKETVWDGVRNYAARLHLNGMKLNDQVLFYHSNTGLAVQGIAKVSKTSYQDPSTDDERWVAVKLKPYKDLKREVSLSAMKKEKKLQNIGLIRIGRLSVMPLTKDEFDLIVKMGS